MIEITDVVRRKAQAAGAEAWLDDLPALTAALADEWGITLGTAYEHSTEALVIDVTCDDGAPAVLKLIVPRDGNAAANEITALQLTDGVGCVRLLRADVTRDALLLERLGRPLYALGLPIRTRHEILCATASLVWRPAPDCGLPNGADKGHWLAEFIVKSWNELDRPCSEQAVDYALVCAQRRIDAYRDERAVLVHGDVHEWNALEAGNGFKLVDPDGLLAEREYDMGILMREDPDDLRVGDPRERSRWIAARMDLDEEAIWEWGVAERVSTGLLLTAVGVQPVGREMLAIAERVAN